VLSSRKHSILLTSPPHLLWFPYLYLNFGILVLEWWLANLVLRHNFYLQKAMVDQATGSYIFNIRKNTGSSYVIMNRLHPQLAAQIRCLFRHLKVRLRGVGLA
jgi:hypothetical protein